MFGLLKKDTAVSTKFICKEGIEVNGLDKLPEEMQSKVRDTLNNLPVKAIPNDNGLTIKVMATALKIPDVVINYSDIERMKVVTGQEIVQKAKSIVGRAVIGDLMLGITGAILLGLSGMGKKEKLINHSYLAINLKNDKVYMLEITAGSNDISKFVAELGKHLE